MACEDGSCIMCKCSTGLGCKDPGEMAYQRSRAIRSAVSRDNTIILKSRQIGGPWYWNEQLMNMLMKKDMGMAIPVSLSTPSYGDCKCGKELTAVPHFGWAYVLCRERRWYNFWKHRKGYASAYGTKPRV